MAGSLRLLSRSWLNVARPVTNTNAVRSLSVATVMLANKKPTKAPKSAAAPKPPAATPKAAAAPPKAAAAPPKPAAAPPKAAAAPPKAAAAPPKPAAAPPKPAAAPPKAAAASTTKGDTYEVPEFFAYNEMSYYEMESDMRKSRLPQPKPGQPCE